MRISAYVGLNPKVLRGMLPPRSDDPAPSQNTQLAVRIYCQSCGHRPMASRFPASAAPDDPTFSIARLDCSSASTGGFIRIASREAAFLRLLQNDPDPPNTWSITACARPSGFIPDGFAVGRFRSSRDFACTIRCPNWTCALRNTADYPDRFA